MPILKNKVDVEGKRTGAEAWEPMWEGAAPDQLRSGPAG